MTPLLLQSLLNLQWSRPKCGTIETQKLFGCRLHIATDLAVTRLSMLHCHSKKVLLFIRNGSRLSNTRDHKKYAIHCIKKVASIITNRSVKNNKSCFWRLHTYTSVGDSKWMLIVMCIFNQLCFQIRTVYLNKSKSASWPLLFDWLFEFGCTTIISQKATFVYLTASYQIVTSHTQVH